MAVAATHHDAGRPHVRVLRPDGLNLAASATSDPGSSHLLEEHLAEDPSHRVAVDPHRVALHLASRRSETLRLDAGGGISESTRAAATDSTKGVGPHTNADGMAEAGHAVSASIYRLPGARSRSIPVAGIGSACGRPPAHAWQRPAAPTRHGRSRPPRTSTSTRAGRLPRRPKHRGGATSTSTGRPRSLRRPTAAALPSPHPTRSSRRPALEARACRPCAVHPRGTTTPLRPGALPP